MQAVKTSAAPSETTGNMGQRRENGSVVAKHDQRHIAGGRLEEKSSHDLTRIRRPLRTTTILHITFELREGTEKVIFHLNFVEHAAMLEREQQCA